jgi:cytochrome c55X
MRRAVVASASLLAAAALVAGPPTAERQAQLRHLLEHDCGSCHGLTLRGGLGPPLLPDALAGKSRALLVATVLYGRPGTAMPPWEPLITREEAEWLVDLMLSGEAP